MTKGKVTPARPKIATVSKAIAEASRLGCKLTKANPRRRYHLEQRRPVRYLLKDQIGVIFFHDLAEVVDWLWKLQRRELERWGWVDREAGVAQIPIEQAMDVVAGEESR